MKDILLIEDDEEVIRQITDTLNDPAYNIIIAETGTQGYLIALKSLPALIICSGEIYDAFGNDMLQKLRDDTIIPGIPFIFLINKNFGKKEKKDSKNDKKTLENV